AEACESSRVEATQGPRIHELEYDFTQLRCCPIDPDDTGYVGLLSPRYRLERNADLSATICAAHQTEAVGRSEFVGHQHGFVRGEVAPPLLLVAEHVTVARECGGV